uniref:Uncharacterized protein n=1 Tax=Amphimedon queenslandica TaxID=400682 RepID=A0A1X7TA09_AMPQE
MAANFYPGKAGVCPGPNTPMARSKPAAEFNDGSHDDTTESLVSNTIEHSSSILNERLCDDATEQEVVSGSVYDHNPELCGVKEYVVALADTTDPIDLPNVPEYNDGTVYDHTLTVCDATGSIILFDLPVHNDSSDVYDALCDVTQFTLACTADDEITVSS